jgi:hypothetical protein
MRQKVFVRLTFCLIQVNDALNENGQNACERCDDRSGEKQTSLAMPLKLVSQGMITLQSHLPYSVI